MASRRRLPTGAQDTILPHKNPTSVTVFREERSLTVAARIEAAHAHPKSASAVLAKGRNTLGKHRQDVQAKL